MALKTGEDSHDIGTEASHVELNRLATGGEEADHSPLQRFYELYWAR